MKHNTLSILKKRGLLVWSVATTFAMMNLFSTSAIAKKSQSTMKRVVKLTSVEKGTLFTSNILMENSDTTYRPQHKTVSSDNSYTTDIFLRNYSTKDILSRYPDDIKYNVSLKLTNKNGVELSENDIDNNKSITIKHYETSITLNKNTRRDTSTFSNLELKKENLQDLIELQFNNWDLTNDEDICVQVIVTPTNSDLQPLSGIVGLKASSDAEPSGWTAYLSEHTSDNDNKEIALFDGFNIIVEGAGEETIIIKLTEEGRAYFGLNKYFSLNRIQDENEQYTVNLPSEVTKTESSDIVCQYTINANSNSEANDYRNRYNIQLYYKDGDKLTNMTWDKLFSVRKNNTLIMGGNDAYVQVLIGENSSGNSNSPEGG